MSDKGRVGICIPMYLIVICVSLRFRYVSVQILSWTSLSLLPNCVYFGRFIISDTARNKILFVILQESYNTENIFEELESHTSTYVYIYTYSYICTYICKPSNVFCVIWRRKIINGMRGEFVSDFAVNYRLSRVGLISHRIQCDLPMHLCLSIKSDRCCVFCLISFSCLRTRRSLAWDTIIGVVLFLHFV